MPRTRALLVALVANGPVNALDLAAVKAALTRTLALPPAPRARAGRDHLAEDRLADLADLAGAAAMRAAGSIRDAVNARYKQEVIHEVLIQQFDFLPKEDVGGEGLQKLAPMAAK